MVLESKSLPGALPASAVALPSSKPSSVLVLPVGTSFSGILTNSLPEVACVQIVSRDLQACEILSACDLSQAGKYSPAVSCCRNKPKVYGKPRQSHFFSHHSALLAQSSTSWEGLTQGERRYTLFLCTYLERLKNQLHNFSTRSCR